MCVLSGERPLTRSPGNVPLQTRSRTGGDAEVSWPPERLHRPQPESELPFLRSPPVLRCRRGSAVASRRVGVPGLESCSEVGAHSRPHGCCRYFPFVTSSVHPARTVSAAGPRASFLNIPPLTRTEIRMCCGDLIRRTMPVADRLSPPRLELERIP